MPAIDSPSFIPDIIAKSDESRTLGHVNLMVDTFIANTDAEDLRPLIRSLLAVGPPELTAKWNELARARIESRTPRFVADRIIFSSPSTPDSDPIATPYLNDLIRQARSMYGVGLGIEALDIFTSVVNATLGLRWKSDGPFEQTLATIDLDIGQAVQSSREQITRLGPSLDVAATRDIITTLRASVAASKQEIEKRDGDEAFQFSRMSLRVVKV